MYTSYDEHQFYPTPEHVVEKMLLKLDNIQDVKYILEPSAGKGDIVKGIENYYRHNRIYEKVSIDTIEINPDCRLFLQDLEVPVIHDNFLTFNTLKRYDAIVMNPPFNSGDEHLLKAIEIQKRYGGQIVCLLNAQTIKNPYTTKRKELLNKLTNLNADIEYMDKLFLTAERAANVKIAIIHISIPEKYAESILFTDLRNDTDYMAYSTDIKDDNLIDKNPLEYFPALYNNEILLGIKLIKEFKALKRYILIDNQASDYSLGNNIQLTLHNKELTINNYIETVRYKYWKMIFSSKMFKEIFTRELQYEYSSKLYELKKYDITPYNIASLRYDIFRELKQSIEDNMLKIFDEFSIKYNYSDFSTNIHYYNGWKTNKSYKINNKVILPYAAWDCIGRYKPGNLTEIFLDIEKIFTMLNGDILGNYEVEKVLNWAQYMNVTKNIQFKFFKVTFYKKGTCHITFTNTKLLDKFNVYGSQKKGWLPPGFGVDSYNNMTQEEQIVIDSFCGKDKYVEIVSHIDEYLLNENKILKIEQ